jgi:isocitrate lyase
LRTERFSHLKRPYTAQEVVKLRGTLKQTYASGEMAKKAWKLFTTLREKKSFSATFGALDTVQVIQMAKYLTTIYVSGWQSSSTASSTNEVIIPFSSLFSLLLITLFSILLLINVM